jgi:glucokinase
MSEPLVLALDVGGTKLAAAVISRSGTLLSVDRVPTPAIRDADVLFEVLRDLGARVVRAGGRRIEAVGVGCGGPMAYPAGVVSPLHLPAWRAFPLRARLTAAFDRPCVLDNDANAFALAEYHFGPHAHLQSALNAAGEGGRPAHLLGMVVSTGVGGGIVRAGRVEHGASGNAGHIGHVGVWPDGPVCACGARGCLEAVASGVGLAQRVELAHVAGRSTSLPPRATAADVAAAARAGDLLAQDLMQAAGTGLGRAIASAAVLLDLDRVIIGGSLGRHAWDLLAPSLDQAVADHARLDFTRALQITCSTLGEHAGLLGAAALALFP